MDSHSLDVGSVTHHFKHSIKSSKS